MKTSQKVVAAALTIALGVLLIVLKSGLVNLVLVGLGVMLIVLGILNIVDKLVPLGVTKIVIGALVALFGGLFWKVMLYIVAALLLLYGILQLYDRCLLYLSDAADERPSVALGGSRTMYTNHH